jgi:hypothetical protein
VGERAPKRRGDDVTPYAATRVPARDLEVFEDVRRKVRRLPDLDLGRDEKGEILELSCHMLARAIALIHPVLEIRDGYYTFHFEHSWLVTPDFNIVDVYPVGIVGGPVLVHHGFQGASVLYQAVMPNTRFGEKFLAPSFGRAVAQITEELMAIRPEALAV